ncbi:hypothetical protein GCM10010156_77640 [Planobispora rosea]|uniref:MFS transporter n=1 Tax=Planobispora rosea TaxID=35762 RepID=A0A8J3S7A9_PLARO|nr:hypothetical protein [Planobispora rosea]GGT09281.1 hypothetical protein GCM10010156_77640 [Planobispora rosea]GIH89272.1 hypothetical protein Pro02_76800 [Planobispora rosea]
MSASPFFRLARAAAFTAVCLGLSVSAHVLAGGPVCAWSAAGGAVLTFAAALAAAGRERSTVVILPLLAGLQVALHVLFSLTHAAPAATLTGQAAEHVHGGLVPGLGMVVMHGWAVALTALWLARGEAVLWALLRRLPLRLSRLLLVRSLPEPVPSFVPPAAGPRVWHSVRLRHAVPRRGPPRQVDAAFG